MKKRDICIYIAACVITIIIQLLLALGIPSAGADPSTRTLNIAVIAINLFMLFMVKKGGAKVDADKVRFERYSIWVLPLISAVWLLTRAFPESIPDIVKALAAGLTIAVGTAGIIIAVKRKTSKPEQTERR